LLRWDVLFSTIGNHIGPGGPLRVGLRSGRGSFRSPFTGFEELPPQSGENIAATQCASFVPRIGGNCRQIEGTCRAKAEGLRGHDSGKTRY